MEDEQKDPAADFGGKSISGVLTKGKSDKDPAAEFGGISVSGTVKKKDYEGGSVIFPITSVSPLERGNNEALMEGAGLADNSFLRQINHQAPLQLKLAPNTPESDYKPIDVSLKPKKVQKQYYTDKLKPENEITAPEDLITYKPLTIDKEGKSKINLKGQDEDYIEKIRKEPFDPFVEGSYFSGSSATNIPGVGFAINIPLAQNFIDKVYGNTTQALAGLTGMYRDLTGHIYHNITGEDENYKLYDKDGNPTKYANSMTWLQDPAGKIIKGLTSSSHDFQNDIQSGFGKLPVNEGGQFVNQITDIGADIATNAALPDIKFLQGVSDLAKFGNALGGKFTGYLGAKGALNAYQKAVEHGEDGLQATQESLTAGAKGLGQGAILGLAGTGSDLLTKAAMKPLEKMGVVGLNGMLTKEGINTITDGIVYGALTPGIEAASQGRMPTMDEMKNGFATSLAFSLKRILGNANTSIKLNKAISQIQDIKQGINLSVFMDASPESIVNIYNGKETAQELNLKALKAAADARNTSDLEKKKEFVSQSVILTKAAGVKQITDLLVNNKGALDNLLQDPTISDNVKKALIDKTTLITKQVDPIEQQKNNLNDKILQVKDSINNLTEQLSNPDNASPRNQAEIQVYLNQAEKDFKSYNDDLIKITKDNINQKAENQEDLSTKEGINKSKDNFNKGIDEQINALDKNSDNYKNDLEALNKKRVDANQHYDELLNPSKIIVNQDKSKDINDKRLEQYNILVNAAKQDPTFKFTESFDDFNKKIDSEGGDVYLRDLYKKAEPFVSKEVLGEEKGHNEDSFVNYLIKPKAEVIEPTQQVTPQVKVGEPIEVTSTETAQTPEVDESQNPKLIIEKEKQTGEKPEDKTYKPSIKGIKKDYDFTKYFESRSVKDVINNVMDKLKAAADNNGVSVEKQAEDESKMIKFKAIGESSEHDIITTTFHLRDLDARIEKANENGEDATQLLEDRNDALTTLRKLGNNAGRNLGLFNNAYKISENGRLEAIKADIKKSLGIDKMPFTMTELNKRTNLPIEDKDYISSKQKKLI